MITMFLAGLWHGAGWTFVAWGCIHGVYLMINNLWREMSRKCGIQLGSGFSWCLTFLAVVVAWVFFRAHNMKSAIEMIKTMFGFYGLHSSLTPNVGIPASNIIFSVIGAMFVAVVLPNIIELIEYRPVIDVNKKIVGTHFHKYLQWRPSRIWAFLLGVALLLCILGFRQTSEFLYFQF
jgi:hypothetical protein